MLAPGLPSPLDLEKSALRLAASTVFESIVKYLDFFFIEGAKMPFVVHEHHSLTWIMLMLKRLHPLLLAKRPLRPGLSSLVPHCSFHDLHLKHPDQLHLIVLCTLNMERCVSVELHLPNGNGIASCNKVLTLLQTDRLAVRWETLPS